MKKYLRLACTVCKREIDKIVNVTHYTPDQCTITLGCEGRLRLVEYRSNGGIVVTPEVGVTDWQPRGSTVTPDTAPKEPNLISLSTGLTGQLVIAVPSETEPTEGSTFNLPLVIKADTPKTYRQYVFRKDTAFTTISGVESGLEKKALRYTVDGTNPDIVEVYVNGVKRERGAGVDDYQIYSSTSSSVPPNTISFNSGINESGVTQVDVIVSKEQRVTTITLSFTRNSLDESRVGTGSYENVSSIDQLIDTEWVRFYLYTLDLQQLASILPLNSIVFAPSTVGAEQFLLARAPYSNIDRYTDVLLPLNGMSEERDYMKYYAVNGEVVLQATDTSITVVYPPFRVNKFLTETTIRTALAGVSEQLVIDGKVIVGPDA